MRVRLTALLTIPALALLTSGCQVVGLLPLVPLEEVSFGPCG